MFRLLKASAFAVLICMASCAGLVRPDHPHGPNEIADHPRILYDGSMARTEMALRGVRLGDPRFAIRDARLLKEADGGWIVCKDGARYRMEDGQVVMLGVWDPRILGRLGIESPADIEARFGRPEHVEDTDQLLLYRYAGGSVSVLWNKQEDQLNAVNISK